MAIEFPGKLEPPAKGVVPLVEMRGDDEEDATLLREMAELAVRYLKTFDWCREVGDGYFGDGVGGIISVLLFNVRIGNPPANEWLWVFVGDIPSAYMMVGNCKTPYEALKRYVSGLSEWINEAALGRTSQDLIPIELPPTEEFARMLQSRVDFLNEHILPDFRDK
jgi:hypothetical protein